MDRLDRHDLYELCVQSPRLDARILAGLHGSRRRSSPRVLRDDFAGPGAIARAWVAEDDDRRAVAVDADPSVLRRAGVSSRVRTIRGDVRHTRARADVIAAMNFGVMELHARRDLVAYLRGVRASLRPGGVFACDLYIGAGALKVHSTRASFRGPRSERIVYTWEQRSVDIVSSRVVNALHFHITPRAGQAYEIRDAFVYDWRLWTCAELREALEEVGLGRVRILDRSEMALDGEGCPMLREVHRGEDTKGLSQVWVAAWPDRGRPTRRKG